MTWCIVKEEKGSGKSFCYPIKDVNGPIDLHAEIFGAKPTIVVLISLEKNTYIPVFQGDEGLNKRRKKERKKEKRHLLPSHKQPQSGKR
jgi:hypothetical protein